MCGKVSSSAMASRMSWGGIWSYKIHSLLKNHTKLADIKGSISREK